MRARADPSDERHHLLMKAMMLPKSGSMGVIRAGVAFLACTWLLFAERPQDIADARCHADTSISKRDPASSDQVKFAVAGGTRVIMRRVSPPDGAIDFRILGAPDAPAILSLIGPDSDRYADYTYNGADADVDVSHGGLNLRPLDGTGSVNVWSMAGNTRLRVGNSGFRRSLDLWHSGLNAHLRSTTGNVIVESGFETRSNNVLGGNTFIDGSLRARPGTPPSNSSDCQAGQIVWDGDFVYVCTTPNRWKRAGLTEY